MQLQAVKKENFLHFRSEGRVDVETEILEISEVRCRQLTPSKR